MQIVFVPDGGFAHLYVHPGVDERQFLRAIARRSFAALCSKSNEQKARLADEEIDPFIRLPKSQGIIFRMDAIRGIECKLQVGKDSDIPGHYVFFTCALSKLADPDDVLRSLGGALRKAS